MFRRFRGPWRTQCLHYPDRNSKYCSGKPVWTKYDYSVESYPGDPSESYPTSGISDSLMSEPWKSGWVTGDPPSPWPLMRNSFGKLFLWTTRNPDHLCTSTTLPHMRLPVPSSSGKGVWDALSGEGRPTRLNIVNNYIMGYLYSQRTQDTIVRPFNSLDSTPSILGD